MLFEKSPRENLLSLALALLLTCGLAVTAFAEQGDQAKSRPGVYTLGLVSSSFKDRPYHHEKELEDRMVSTASRAFLSSRRFKLIEREKLVAVFNEKDLANILDGGDSDLSKIKGVDYIGVIDFGSERQRSPGGGSQTTYWIDVRLIEVRTAAVLTTLSSRRDLALSPATDVDIVGDRLLINIREQFPPQGHIVDISPERVLVNIGKNMGLEKGDRLEVVREGERFIDPVEHTLIEAEEIVIGVLKVTTVGMSTATCAIKDAESDFAVADRIRLKAKDAQDLSRAGRVLRKVRNAKRWFRG